MSLRSGGVPVLGQGGVSSANCVSDVVVTWALTDPVLDTTAPAALHHCTVTDTNHL